MSDTMLLGVLRMPFDLAMATLTAQIQYHQRGVQAADAIEKRTRERDEARAEVDRLRAEIERMQAEMPVAKSLETAVTCLTIERDKARSVVAGQAREIADLRAEMERLRTGLDRLARLGNEPNYGNSFGNRLARQALEAKP